MPLSVDCAELCQNFTHQLLNAAKPNSNRSGDHSIEAGCDRYTRVIVHQMKRMAESQAIEAVYENGIFRPVHPVTGLVEHSKVRLVIEYEAQAIHSLAEFAGIVSNEEAEDVQAIVAKEFSKVVWG